LNYRPKEVFETYFSFALTKWTTLSLGFQFIATPGYNTDRGPVPIGSMRFHAEF